MKTTSEASLHIWIRARHDAVDRLARYSKMAIDAGIAEWQVANAERLGKLVGELLRRVLGEIQLTAEQQDLLPGAVRRHLTLIAAAFGQLEVAVMHSRNAFREIVASDDLIANAERVGQITSLLEPIAQIAEALHSTFADFDATLRGRAGG